MSTRMFARRLASLKVNAGGDDVLFGFSLPAGAMINNLRARVAMWDLNGEGTTETFMYAIEGWILPVLDPDAATTLQDIWDALVPKDTDVDILDLDTGALDTTPFFEPGEADLSQMLDVGLRPERVYHRHAFLSYADGSLFTYQDNQTPFNILWTPGTTVRIRLGKKYRVREPSVLVFGLASPSLDDTTTSLEAAASENEWGRLQYIQDVVQMALQHQLGIIDSGAESPWEESSALLRKHLEPNPYEETAGRLASVAWETVTEAILDMSVPGTMENITVTTGR